MKRMPGQERRAQIVEGAYSVILEKGLAGTATRDVTRELGVGSGLLHHYFSSWAELRAEVVKTFIAKEIAALNDALSHDAPDEVFGHFVNWMVSDPEFRFWRLWLDAIEEARRDPELADIVQDGYMQWHASIVALIDRAADKDLGNSIKPQHVAWRISALVDGLMGMLVFGRTHLTGDFVKDLLHEQINLELCRN